jgi:hypothetical protein
VLLCVQVLGCAPKGGPVWPGFARSPFLLPRKPFGVASQVDVCVLRSYSILRIISEHSPRSDRIVRCTVRVAVVVARGASSLQKNLFSPDTRTVLSVAIIPVLKRWARFWRLNFFSSYATWRVGCVLHAAYRCLYFFSSIRNRNIFITYRMACGVRTVCMRVHTCLYFFGRKTHPFCRSIYRTVLYNIIYIVHFYAALCRANRCDRWS